MNRTSMILVVTGIAVCLFLAMSLWRSESRMIANIERRGGRVAVDNTNPNSPILVVELMGGKFSNSDVRDLRKIPNLHSLVLQSTNITDTGISELRKLTSLRSLDLSGVFFTSRGLHELKNLTSLTTLAIHGPMVDDAVVGELVSLRNLRELRIHSSYVTNDALSHLRELKNLESLILVGAQITKTGLAELRDLKNIGDIRLPNCTRITDEDLSAFEGMTNLKRLNLARTFITNSSAKVLAEIKSLQSLNLNHTSLTESAIKDFADLPNLRSLSIQNMKLTQSGYNDLRSIANLESLSLSWMELAELNELREMPNLTTLSIHGRGRSDVREVMEGLRGFSKLTSLSIDLRGNEIANSGLGMFVKLEHLSIEVYRFDQISESGLRELKKMSGLKSLELVQLNVIETTKFENAFPGIRIGNRRWHYTPELQE